MVMSRVTTNNKVFQEIELQFQSRDGSLTISCVNSEEYNPENLRESNPEFIKDTET